MTALSDLLGRLDPDPLRRGKQFERICRWFLTHDPVYAHELRRVWLWDEWPGRCGADAGIDLVAEDRRGKLWAIQVKAYDAASWITKRDVDTFLEASGRTEFSFRLLIATTNLIGRTAKRTIDGQEKQASVVLLDDLQAAEVDWQGLVIAEELAAAEPANTGFRRELSDSYDRLADPVRSAGRAGEAERLYRQGLVIAEELAAAEPANTRFRRELSVSYGRLADLVRSAGRGRGGRAALPAGPGHRRGAGGRRTGQHRVPARREHLLRPVGRSVPLGRAGRGG